MGDRPCIRNLTARPLGLLLSLLVTLSAPAWNGETAGQPGRIDESGAGYTIKGALPVIPGEGPLTTDQQSTIH
ncbi:MAG TPA: hypothetical protein VES73_01580 [Lamprocystis sp. (in: g-proteobacteria)]|nr:hypothetical protein [Lamprocystis sp. (in: g-proteobacteria)]